MEALCELIRRCFDANELPIDVRKIARGMGITVLEQRWRGRPHAASVPGLSVIILNKNRPETARRFDLAHELGHFVVRKDGHPTPPCYPPLKGRMELHTDAENRFAACLLMPRRRFEAEVVRAMQSAPAIIPALFEVGLTAMAIRHHDLRHGHAV